MAAAPSRAGHSARDNAVGDIGDGVFARADILDGTVVAFYNGVRARARDDDEEEVDEDENAYRVNLSEREDLDIPWPYRSLQHYSATLGHKVRQ